MKFWKNKKTSPNSVTPPFQFYPSPSVLPFPSNITPRKKPYPSSLTPPHQPQQTLPLLINLTPPQQTLPLLINLTPSQKPPVVEPSTLVIRICEYGILYCLMFCDKKNPAKFISTRYVQVNTLHNFMYTFCTYKQKIRT